MNFMECIVYEPCKHDTKQQRIIKLIGFIFKILYLILMLSSLIIGIGFIICLGMVWVWSMVYSIDRSR